ncbi:AAA family ATPase, partial [Psittacicella gerlachiana]
TQNRGNIYSSLSNSTASIHIGTLKDRKDKYKQNLLKIIENPYDNTMDNDVNGWFINIAYSSNKYQTVEENREIELITVLRILNKIDSRIDPNPENFKIVDGFAQIMVDGEYLKLNELSSGFASILKIVQSIVSGYGIFTNSDNIENVTGYVLIDEIESHLHLEWQTKILPTLNEIFPNTYFIVTTHSPLILYQLYNGAAFKLEKNKGYIKTVPIDSPSRYALIDLLDEIFDIDLNKIKLERKDPTRIQRKSEMLNLLRGGVA